MPLLIIEILQRGFRIFQRILTLEPRAGQGMDAPLGRGGSVARHHAGDQRQLSRYGAHAARAEKASVRKPDGLLSVVCRQYREYPNFCNAREERAEHYNQCRERLFDLERRGKVLVIAPEYTLADSRTERDVEKLQLLWAQGYQMAVERMEEIREYLNPQGDPALSTGTAESVRPLKR